MIQEPPNSHTVINHDRAKTPPELRRVNDAVLNDLAKQAGLSWDKSRPLPTPPKPASEK